MRKFIYNNSLPSELFQKERKDVKYIRKKDWEKYVKDTDEDYRIVGQTKLKPFKEDKNNKDKNTDILIVPIKDNDKESEKHFIVKERFRFTRLIGYIPVENHEYIKLVRFNFLWLLLPLLLILLIGTGIWWFTRPEPEQPVINRYIEENKTEIVNEDSSATRYRFNTTMTIVKDTIQNINFENVNEKKQLQIKIKLHPDDKDYIYDSGLIPHGQIVKADTLLKHAEPGEYSTIAECYSYNEGGEQQSQTNFEVRLIVK